MYISPNAMKYIVHYRIEWKKTERKPDINNIIIYDKNLSTDKYDKLLYNTITNAIIFIIKSYTVIRTQNPRRNESKAQKVK